MPAEVQPNPFDLFTPFAERAMHRLNEVVMGRNCPWPITNDQYALLVLLRTRQGLARAISLGEVGERLKLSPRKVKDLVQDLRLSFGVQIASSRDGEAGGYFLASSQQEIEDSIHLMFSQAITMLRVCKAMRGPQHTAAELAGQVRLALEKGFDR